MASPTDERIIERVLEGHTEDYRELVQRYGNSVFRLAYRMLGNREEAEDAAQEAFVNAYSKLRACRERDKFWPWIRRIAVNVCLSKRRREYPYDQPEALSGIDCADADPVETEVLKRAEMEYLRRAVMGLPSAYRDVVVLRYQEQLSYKEIAGCLGESVIVIQMRLFRARKMLAERLEVISNEVR